MDFVSDINISGGGPLIARKLRIFASFRDWRVHVNVPAAFSTLVLDKTDITSGLVNANYQVNDNNRLTGFYSRQYYKKPNRFLTASNVTVLESTSNEDDVFDIYQVLWNSVVTQKFFIDARVGLNRDLLPDLPERQRPDAARHRHQHPHAQRHDRHRTLARSLPDEHDRPVLRRRGARRPARVQVRLRLLAHARREPRCRASTTSI